MTFYRRLCFPFVGAALLTAAFGCTSTSVTTPGQPSVKCIVTPTGPAGSIAAGGGDSSIAVSAASECQWVATTNTNWITDIAPTKGQGPGDLHFKAGPNPNPAARQGEISVNGTAVPVTQDPAPCVFVVVPLQVAVPAAGGEISVTVTTTTGCAWQAVVDAPWVTLASGASGTASSTVRLTVAANPGGARSAHLAVGGQTVSIAQSAQGVCASSIDPTAEAIGSSGGNLSTNVKTAAGCAWTAVSNVPWITITSGAKGSGSGTVSFTVAPNTGTARTGTLLIAEQTFTVSQAAAPSCSFTVAPLSQAVGASGGLAAPITVTTLAGCAWTAVSNDGWIRVSSGAAGTDSGSVLVVVSSNNGVARTGTLLVAGHTVTINQAAAETTCSFVVAPLTQSIGALGGQGTAITVTTGASCAWTAASNDAWLQIISGISGTGNGSVSFTVGVNLAGPRTGTMTIAGQRVTINQAAVIPTCVFAISPTNQHVGAASGTGTPIAVTTSDTCEWGATTETDWLHLVSPSNGSGNGSVGWRYDANLGPVRAGTIAVAGRTFAVTQDQGCSYTINPTSGSFNRNGLRNNSIAVATQASCPWAVSTTEAWITIESGTTGTGPGTVVFSVDRNDTGKKRSGTITVAGQTFTADQSK
jgi:hypothetical protein